ncbi:MAG: efflux RND transporter periplasmic adaptor subunit [Desulfovibrionaceae bacterium]|nr:efflux RND transporter periplasmic adaptor subunit [Desulfovibrionaceae bacterium]
MKAMFVCRILCLAALAVLIFSSPASADETTILTGKVRTTVTREPYVHFNGIVDSVLVAPGEHVSKGQPIFRYTLQNEARRSLQREVNQGASTEGMEAQVLDLSRQLAQVQAQRNKARSLAASGLGSNQTSDRLQVDVQSLENRIQLIKESIAKAQDNFGLRLKELSEYFDTEITERATLPEYLYLKSPIDGYVLSIATNMNPGATFGAGAAPISIGQMDPMLIQVPVYEAEVSSLKLGDEAVVEIPSLGNKTFKATITEIAWVSNQMDVAQASYFNVELTIPNPDLELKPGFKAVVRFTLK